MLLPSYFYHLSFELYPTNTHQQHTQEHHQYEQHHHHHHHQTNPSASDTYYSPPPRTNIFKVNLPDHAFDFAHGLGSSASELDKRTFKYLNLDTPRTTNRHTEPDTTYLNTDANNSLSGPPKGPVDCRFGRVDMHSIDMVSQNAAQAEAKGKALRDRDLSSEFGPGLAGPATKARFIPSDPKNTSLGVGVVHLYRDVEETPGLYDDGPPPVTKTKARESGAGPRTGTGTGETSFDEKDCTTLCILAVPSYLSPSDFMGFVGEKTREEVSHFRMIRTERTNRYMVLMKFREARKARAWRKEWNGKAFDSMGAETCHVVFIKSIHFQTPGASSDPSSFPNMANDPFTPSPHANATATSTSSSSSSSAAENTALSRASLSTKPVAPRTPSLVELPTCPVCLERMDETTGLLTIVCQHVFHCECLHKWRGSGCPICRYTQGQGLYGVGNPSSSAVGKEDIVKECSVCASDANLWICLICGNVGCGRYDEAHAFAHYTATTHAYAMDLVTQRVWDYAGDGYVHRLIHNTPDGKFVDLHSSTSLYHSDNPSFTLTHEPASKTHNSNTTSRDPASHESIPAPDPDSKVSHLDTLGMEYTHLLTSQLESQRAYYEDKLVRAADKASRASKSAESANLASTTLQRQLSDLQSSHDKLVQETIPSLERDKARLANKAEKFENMARVLQGQYRDEQAVSTSLLERIRYLEDKLNKAGEEVEELRDMNRDLSFFISGQEKLRALAGDEAEGLGAGASGHDVEDTTAGGGEDTVAAKDAGIAGAGAGAGTEVAGASDVGKISSTKQHENSTAHSTKITDTNTAQSVSTSNTSSGPAGPTGPTGTGKPTRSGISAEEIQQASISIPLPEPVAGPGQGQGQGQGRGKGKSKGKGKRRVR